MFVVVTYDVAARRTEIFRKLLGRYLTHEQNSVFAGKLTESSWRKLKSDISKCAVPEDRILVFRAKNRRNMDAAVLSKSPGNGVLMENSILHHEMSALIL